MSKKIISLFLALLMCLSVLSVAAFAEDAEDPGAPTEPVIAPAPEEPAEKEFEGKTVILHSNDVHGSIAGYAYMAALAKNYESKGAEVILVDAGDFSQGTSYVSTTKGADAVTMMNAVGYDYATLGNHEFDYGYAQLKENLGKAEFKTLCADVFEGEETIFAANDTYETKGGVKIGFFGLATPESQTKANPALIQGLKFLAADDMYACANEQVKALADDDIVIAITHLGVDDESAPNRSYDLYANTEGIDFIIDGHSHTVMTEGKDKEPIQSTGTAFANIGVIVIDDATKKIEDNYLEEVLDEPLMGSSAVSDAAQEIIDKVSAEYGVVFAKSEVELNGEKAKNDVVPNGNRDGETNSGDLICDSMVWSILKDKDSLTVDADKVVAITNGGGIRAWIHKGDITKQNVNDVLPFGNTVAVVYVTGAELLEALEASTYCTPEAVGGFPQVAGINFTVDIAKAYDANKETYPDSTYYGPASINRVTINSINGKEFDPEATYAVITNNFCAAGGDTYYAFASAKSQFDTGIPLDEALMSYITEELDGVIGEKYAKPDGRITVKCSHDLKDAEVTPASRKAEGKISGVCPVCGEEVTEKIAKIEKVSLKYTKYKYSGKKINPKVTVLDADGNKLVKGKDYKVTYPKNSTKVGKYCVTIKFIGKYKGAAYRHFRIVPKGTTIKKAVAVKPAAKAKKRAVTVTIAKNTKQTKGYEIQYAANKNFKGAKVKTVKNTAKTAKLTKLKAGTKYYVRVRTYKTVKVDGKNVKFVSAWSKAVKVKTAK